MRVRITFSGLAERWVHIWTVWSSALLGRSRGAIISQYYNRTMRLRRHKQSRPSIQDISRSARPSIRDYGIEEDTTDAESEENSMRDETKEHFSCAFISLPCLSLCVCVCRTVSKRDRLVNNLQNLSVGDRGRMLREIPLSVAEKSLLR